MSAAPKAKVYIIIYTTWHHIYTLAQQVAKGVEATGAEVKIWQVPETLPADVLEKLHAAPKPDLPVIKPENLAEADALIFGIPTRFGTPAAQIKALFDATGQLWFTKALYGKIASIFFSTGSLGGGQETTAYTALPFFAHHGLIYVPLGYGHPGTSNNKEVHGGSPWGAGTLSDTTGQRAVSDLEKEVAEFQGKHVAEIANALKIGRQHNTN
jgi:NAD(P)H:quinone oxidoreductase type IV